MTSGCRKARGNPPFRIPSWFSFRRREPGRFILEDPARACQAGRPPRPPAAARLSTIKYGTCGRRRPSTSAIRATVALPTTRPDPSPAGGAWLEGRLSSTRYSPRASFDPWLMADGKKWDWVGRFRRVPVASSDLRQPIAPGSKVPWLLVVTYRFIGSCVVIPGRFQPLSSPANRAVEPCLGCRACLINHARGDLAVPEETGARSFPIVSYTYILCEHFQISSKRRRRFVHKT
jgi:hypothetical protein